MDAEKPALKVLEDLGIADRNKVIWRMGKRSNQTRNYFCHRFEGDSETADNHCPSCWK